jgi:hypothetical protein
VIAKEAREAVNHDNIEGRGFGRARLDHALELGPAIVGRGSARFDEGLNQRVTT